MEEQIKKLRKEGKSYKQIAKILNCAKSTVTYWLSDGAKEKARIRSKRHANGKMIKLKALFGNKCRICGYNKSKWSLHFHHLKDKKFNLGETHLYKWADLVKEAKKCILICANCHGELHQGVIKL